MGFNFSGLVINENYKDKFDNLQKEFRWKLIKESEIDFQTGSSNWKEKGICDVFFFEKGTFIFVNMDLCLEHWCLKNSNVLTFAYSETSMSFSLNYCEKGVLIRNILELDGKRIEDDGEKELGIEYETNDISAIIFGQIKFTLGEDFYSINPDKKGERYIFTKYEEEEEFEEEADYYDEEGFEEEEDYDLVYENQYKEEKSENPLEKYNLSELDKNYYKILDDKNEDEFNIAIRKVLLIGYHDEYKRRGVSLPEQRYVRKKDIAKWWEFWK